MKFTGKPQKKSILHFFSPTPPPAQGTQQKPPPVRATSDTNNAQTSQSPNASALEALRGSTLATTPPSAADPPATSTASMRTRAIDYDALPPVASQTSANSGESKRVVSNGEQVVLNSDSDTESLASLNWGESKKTTRIATSTTHSKRTSDDDEEALRRPQKQARNGKRTLTVVVETAQRNQELEQRIKEHKADLEKSFEEPVVTRLAINEESLGQVIEDEGEPGKAQRLFQAIQRTDVRRTDRSYYFFGNTPKSARTRSKIPVNSLAAHSWVSIFQDSTKRDQAFLTGFAYQIFQLQGLPEELASWIIDEICAARNELLNTKYLDILELQHEHLERLLDQRRLDSIFASLGGDVQSLESTAELESKETRSSTEPPLSSPLKSVARLLHRAAPRLRSNARTHALHLLLHTCLDEHVLADADMLYTIQGVMEAIICNFADNNGLTSALSKIIAQLPSRITHATLQRNLISALPSKSPMTSYLRRYLALSFFLYPQTVDVPLAHPKIPNLIHMHLDTSPHFRVDKATDYNSLAARLELLDVAIGPGPLSVPYQPLVSPAPSQAGSSPIMAPLPASSEVKDFNREVDALAQHVKILGNSIVEAGAVTDLTILEAKDCIERLCARLEHAVRIGGKKVHNLFGNEEDDEKQQLKMSKFLTKRSRPSMPAPPRGIFDDEEDDAQDEIS